MRDKRKDEDIRFVTAALRKLSLGLQNEDSLRTMLHLPLHEREIEGWFDVEEKFKQR